MKIPDHVIDLAEKVCMKSNMSHKLSAILYNNKGTVINVGYNRRLVDSRSPTVIKRHGLRWLSVHAEVDALSGINFNDLHKYNLYVHRVGGKLARPCVQCRHILDMYSLNRVYWSGQEV